MSKPDHKSTQRLIIMPSETGCDGKSEMSQRRHKNKGTKNKYMFEQYMNKSTSLDLQVYNHIQSLFIHLPNFSQYNKRCIVQENLKAQQCRWQTKALL